MAPATQHETVLLAIGVLANMTGQRSFTLDYLPGSGYTLMNESGSYAPFGNERLTKTELHKRILFAIAALRMVQNTANQVTVVFVKDSDLETVETYGFRGHIELAKATKYAVDAEVFKLCTDFDYSEAEARAFLEESWEFDAQHINKMIDE